MASTERKLKTLRVLQLLLEWSDPEHPLTAEEIILLLGKYDLDADRRSIYSDIAVINQLDPSTLEIEKAPGNHGQYVSKRMFELSELKLLIDAVQVAKFIPPTESRTLIKKLGSLASVHQSKDLRREIHLCDPPVGDNQVLNSVDVIHTAMNDNRRIEFQYDEWTPRKTKQLRRNGMVYQVSPWKLLWDNEYYYLLAFAALESDPLTLQADVTALEEKIAITEQAIVDAGGVVPVDTTAAEGSLQAVQEDLDQIAEKADIVAAKVIGTLGSEVVIANLNTIIAKLIAIDNKKIKNKSYTVTQYVQTVESGESEAGGTNSAR